MGTDYEVGLNKTLGGNPNLSIEIEFYNFNIFSTPILDINFLLNPHFSLSKIIKYIESATVTASNVEILEFCKALSTTLNTKLVQDVIFIFNYLIDSNYPINSNFLNHRSLDLNTNLAAELEFYNFNIYSIPVFSPNFIFQNILEINKSLNFIYSEGRYNNLEYLFHLMVNDNEINNFNIFIPSNLYLDEILSFTSQAYTVSLVKNILLEQLINFNYQLKEYEDLKIININPLENSIFINKINKLYNSNLLINSFIISSNLEFSVIGSPIYFKYLNLLLELNLKKNLKFSYSNLIKNNLELSNINIMTYISYLTKDLMFTYHPRINLDFNFVSIANSEKLFKTMYYNSIMKSYSIKDFDIIDYHMMNIESLTIPELIAISTISCHDIIKCIRTTLLKETLNTILYKDSVTTNLKNYDSISDITNKCD